MGPRLALTFVALATLAPTSIARAGGWTQSEGACYAKLDARLLVGSGAYQSSGLRDTRSGIVDYFDLQAGFYAECGVDPRVTALVFGTPLGYASAGRDTAYMGPIGAGLRIDPIGDGAATRLAFQLDYAVAPAVGDVTLFDEAGGAPRTFYQPALENHYGELSVHLGHGFGLGDDVSGWVNASVGARVNTGEGMTPALVANAQLGFTFFRWLGVEIYFPLYEPFLEDMTETNVAGVGQTRYLGFGARVSAWMIDELAVFASVDGVFYASSNAAAPSIRVGLESRFHAWAPDD